MSWFLGGIGNFNEDLFTDIQRLAPAHLFNIFSGEMFLIAGGIPNTFKYEINNHIINKKNWLQVGAGITREYPKKFLSNSDWQNIVDNNFEENVNIDGHYVLASWDNNKLIITTDRIGLRDFYFCKDEQGNIFFSTRIDWLARFVNTEIDFKEFGSRWLLFNQISIKSILKNITRVAGGNVLIIDRIQKKIDLKINSWLPKLSGVDYSEENFYEDLKSLISFPMRDNKLSLSLSGGLDSRVIFSYLVNQEGNWDAHSFGSEKHPDFIIAKRIADDFKINHVHLDSPEQSSEEFLAELREYSSATVINTAASSLMQLGHYKLLQNSPEIIIDGCPGEIWRRQFFNRLSYFGKKFILNRDFKNIIKLITYHKADIFNDDVNELMLKGSEEQLKEIFEILPTPEIIGVENWIDIFAIKTRYPNYFLHEQARTDSIVLTYMPFTQISILENLLLMKYSLKKNARLLRKIISRNAPSLKKHPLVKGNIVHPFILTPLQTRLWSLAAKKLQRKIAEDNYRALTLKKLSDVINDFANSKSILKNSHYDERKLRNLFQSFNSNENAAYEIDWWLSLEMFNQQINLKKIK
jgi:hypothetical protein